MLIYFINISQLWLLDSKPNWLPSQREILEKVAYTEYSKWGLTCALEIQPTLIFDLNFMSLDTAGVLTVNTLIHAVMKYK